MGHYSVVGTGTQNSASEDVFVELFPPANVAIAIKRLVIQIDSDTYASGENIGNVGVYRMSTASTGMVAGTIVKKDGGSPASVTTVNVKNGTNGTTIGTKVDTLIRFSVNQWGAFEWLARDKNDYLWSGVNQRVIVAVFNQNFNRTPIVECDWIE